MENVVEVICQRQIALSLSIVAGLQSSMGDLRRLTHSQSSELLHCIAQDELEGMTLPGPGILECRYDTHCDVRIGNGSVMYEYNDC